MARLKKGIPTIEEVRLHVNANLKDFLTVKEAFRLRASGKLNGPMPHDLAQLASQLAVALLHHVMNSDESI